VLAAEIEVCRLRVRVERLRLNAVRALIFERSGMAGEIRDAMALLRAARATMVSDMLKEIGGVVDEVKATHVDGCRADDLRASPITHFLKSKWTRKSRAGAPQGLHPRHRANRRSETPGLPRRTSGSGGSIDSRGQGLQPESRGPHLGCPALALWIAEVEAG
jgi:hypothetical protein